MKIRYWLTGMAAVLILGCVMTLQVVQWSRNAEPVDMPELNRQFQEVDAQIKRLKETGAASETAYKELEKEYHCQIIRHEAEDYEADVYNAIREQKILMDVEVDGRIVAKAAFDGQKARMQEMYHTLRIQIIVVFAVLGVWLIVLGMEIYFQYIRPFYKLQRFAAQIAKGNLDFPLAMQKSNYFGAFTESFDIMREELKKAKQGEYQANVSKKELVASLSHDIKTPVATIRAICEILLLKLKDEETLEKILIINRKAGTIDALISDMFHATLEDLSALKIEPREELSTIIRPMFEEINYDGRIHFQNEVPECLLCVDALRLNQVIDNVVNNSYKYAGTDISVSFYDEKQAVKIRIADHGAGVPEEELPLIQEKFYRGSNSEGKDGSGLGLYLSRIFMEGMGGQFACESRNGFIVCLTLPKAN